MAGQERGGDEEKSLYFCRKQHLGVNATRRKLNLYKASSGWRKEKRRLKAKKKGYPKKLPGLVPRRRNGTLARARRATSTGG